MYLFSLAIVSACVLLSKIDAQILDAKVVKQKFDQMEKQLQRLNNQVKSQQTQIKELQNKLQTQENKIKTLVVQIQSQDTKLHTQNNRIQVQEKLIHFQGNEIQTQVNRMETQENITLIQGIQIQTQEFKVQTLETKTQAQENIIKIHANEIQIQGNEIQNQENRIKAQENLTIAHGLNIQTLKIKTQTHENKIKTQENKIQIQQNEIQNLGNKIVIQENKFEIQEKLIQNQGIMINNLGKNYQGILSPTDNFRGKTTLTPPRNTTIAQTTTPTTNPISPTSPASALPETCSALLLRQPSLPSGTHNIYPQGNNSSAVQVYCDMTSKNSTGVTVITHDSELRTLVMGTGINQTSSYQRNIQYDISIKQIVAIIKHSKSCEQFIRYECYQSRLSIGSRSWWVSRQGSKMSYWGDAAVNSGKCACGMTSSCTGGGKCDCDANDRILREDSGFLTDKNTLPVTELRFGDVGGLAGWRVGEYKFGYHTLGDLRCWG